MDVEHSSAGLRCLKERGGVRTGLELEGRRGSIYTRMGAVCCGSKSGLRLQTHPCLSTQQTTPTKKQWVYSGHHLADSRFSSLIVVRGVEDSS